MVVDSTLIEVAGVSRALRFLLPKLELFSVLASSVVDTDAASSFGASLEPLPKACSDWRVLLLCAGDSASTTRAVSRDIRDDRIVLLDDTP